MRSRPPFAALLVALLLAACNLVAEPQVEQPLSTATGAAGNKPQVTISSPQNGDEVVINERVLVSATATDSVGVQRVQLLADGQIVKTVSSESSSGDTSLNVLLDYTPRREGELRMQVIAYRGAVASDPAALELVVRQNVAQVTSTPVPASNIPQIDPNDPTCRILTNVGLNLRTGPGTTYAVVTVLRAGTVAPIIGRTGSNDWWQVRVNTTIGWVSAEFTTEYGLCGNVPLVNPPATPTGVASSTPPPTWTPPPTFTPVTPATAAPGLPDLVVSNVSGPEDLRLPNGNAEVVGTYAVTITNAGGATTGQFTNVVVRTPGNVEIPLGVVSNLSGGESILLTVEIAFSSRDDFTLQIRLDSNANVNESNESNNNVNYNVTVDD